MSLIDSDLIRKYRERSDRVLRREHDESEWRFKKHMFFGTMSGLGSVGSITFTCISGGAVAAATIPTSVLAAATALDNFADAENIRKNIEAIEFVMEEREALDSGTRIEIELQDLRCGHKVEIDDSIRPRRIHT